MGHLGQSLSRGVRVLQPGAALLALMLVAIPSVAAGEASAGWRRLELGQGRYALRYLPTSAVGSTTELPLVVFLHGSGSSPEAWQSLLAGPAENAGVVLLMPHAVSSLGFGPGDDAGTLDLALAALAAEIPTDPRRRALAGFSSGGAFALYLAHTSAGSWSAVWALGAPYRIVVAPGEPTYPMPTRLVYGQLDPNYTGGSYLAWHEQLQRLGGPLEESLLAGIGHGGYPATTYDAGLAFLLGQIRPEPISEPGPCQPDATTLCLLDGRFSARLAWQTPFGEQGEGLVTTARTRESGLFYFFSPNNWELQVKVLDGCALNGHFWVFTAGSTNVGYTLTIRDLQAERDAIYHNPVGQVALAVTDTAAFATCP